MAKKGKSGSISGARKVRASGGSRGSKKTGSKKTGSKKTGIVLPRALKDARTAAYKASIPKPGGGATRQNQHQGGSQGGGQGSGLSGRVPNQLGVAGQPEWNTHQGGQDGHGQGRGPSGRVMPVAPIVNAPSEGWQGPGNWPGDPLQHIKSDPRTPHLLLNPLNPAGWLPRYKGGGRGWDVIPDLIWDGKKRPSLFNPAYWAAMKKKK